MPVVAVVAAFVAVEAAVAATTLFSVITAVGAVTAAVGAVTGNEKLMKIGSIIGIVGAVGGFAANSGLFGGAEGAAGASELVGNPTGYEGDAGDFLGASGGEGAGGGGGGGSGMIGALEAPVPALTPAIDPMVPEGVPSVVEPTPVPQPSADLVPSPLAETAPVVPLNTDASAQIAQGASTPGQLTTADMAPSLMPTTFDSLMGTFSKLGKYAKENPMMASSILSGVSSAADPSQRNLRAAQTGNLNANTAMTNQMLQNQKGVGGLIDWTKVFKTPVPTGMIGRGG